MPYPDPLSVQIIDLPDESATLRAGALIAAASKGTGRIYLSGDLGAGKTTLCRGIIRALGHEGAVKSPTFTLVEPYELDVIRVYHFDFYRLEDPEELDYLGIEDYFSQACLCLVEWPENAQGTLSLPDLVLELTVSGYRRTMTARAFTDKGIGFIRSLEWPL